MKVKNDNHFGKNSPSMIICLSTHIIPRTADFQTTSGLRKIIENNGNQDDIIAFFEERLLPVDEIQAQELAEELLQKPPELGYLTISNALQWRLQYSRVIQEAGNIEGINKVY